MVRLGLHEAALGLLDELLGGRLVGAGGFNGGGARPCSGEGLIVDLHSDFAFVDEQFVALKIVLGFDVVGFRGLRLGMSGGELAFGGDDSRLSVHDI